MTKESDAVTAFLSKIGKKGGKKSSANLTPEQRSERARKAAQASLEAYPPEKRAADAKKRAKTTTTKKRVRNK